MKYVFYITNHGYGHASRNVPIIKELLQRNKESRVVIKSDKLRCSFLEKNLRAELARIDFFDDCTENGIILQENGMLPDLRTTEDKVRKDLLNWDDYVKRENAFLERFSPDYVVSDVISWGIKAAKQCGIKTILIGNFTWAEMYKSYFPREIWEPYQKCYELADKAIWYAIHSKEVYSYCKNYECVSLVSRKFDKHKSNEIKNSHKRPIVFISLGASAELQTNIDVSRLPYDFIVTHGVGMQGNNVENLPLDTINTPDYIAASDYVIAKGGWSTVAEILLQEKKCGLLFRGNNPEDNATKRILAAGQQCVVLEEENLYDIEGIIQKIRNLNPASYSCYHDDTNRICDIICNT